MKKPIKIAIKWLLISTTVMGVLCLGFFGNSNIETINSIISDKRISLFQGEASQTMASLTCGVREEPYLQNGKKETMVEFGIVKAKFLVVVPEQTFEFVLSYNGQDVHGTMEKSPYENVYYCDIEQQVPISAEVVLSFSLPSVQNTSITLSPISAGWTINSNQALEIATKQLEEKKAIKNLIFTTKIFNVSCQYLECHLQIISNDAPLLSNHFWRFCLLSESDELFSCVIDPTNGDVLAQS